MKHIITRLNRAPARQQKPETDSPRSGAAIGPPTPWLQNSSKARTMKAIEHILVTNMAALSKVTLVRMYLAYTQY
ncbi:MAG: hypothetical protein I8H82_06325 [Rhodocyclales bacterium]|nr:hypothetical protein [Rhodocyclales bacterium]MBH1974983.1 hypothetical protein [Rhodocyclales bacterium]